MTSHSEQTAPHNGTPTSREAAEAIAPQIPRLEDIVHLMIKQHGDLGLTDEEIDQIASHYGNIKKTLRPRRVALAQRGVIVDSGRTRKTSSNRNAVVWVLKKDETK